MTLMFQLSLLGLTVWMEDDDNYLTQLARVQLHGGISIPRTSQRCIVSRFS